MKAIKTNDGNRVELEGPSQALLFCGIKDSDLIMSFIESRNSSIKENIFFATKQGWIK